MQQDSLEHVDYRIHIAGLLSTIISEYGACKLATTQGKWDGLSGNIERIEAVFIQGTQLAVKSCERFLVVY